MAIRISTMHYDSGTYVLSKPPHVIGTCSKSRYDDDWLMDVRRKTGGFETLPKMPGSLLQVLRIISKTYTAEVLTNGNP